jgi:esterase
MQRLRVNDYDMAYIDIGEGAPLVCVHGSLCDYRTWGPVLGPLSRRHRLFVPSLRRFFPEAWNGVGPGFTIAQHTSDMIAFIEKLGLGPVDLMGHSRGGHIAFRIAQQRPELLRRLVLAEPGGNLDDSFASAGGGPSAHPPLRTHVAAAADKIRAGDVEGGLASFWDAIEGQGAWQLLTAGARRQFRDNALTLIGQVNEQRPPYRRAEAEAISVPTLLIGGAQTQGSLPEVLRGLAAHIPGARVAMIQAATHMMFEQDPERFCAAVLDFLAAR